MRMARVIIGGLALALLVSACGAEGDSDDSAGSLRPPPKVVPLGPFAGECGHVTDEEVGTIAGLGPAVQVFKNAVGCNWQAGGIGSSSITFAWYRGSPIDRELAWVTAQGRNPQRITVVGYPGFQDSTADGGICDLAVQLDDDFFEWSSDVGFFGNRNADPCEKNRKLAELTIQRLK